MPNISPVTGQDKRRNAFDKYYKAHPEKLGGRSLDEAFAAMRREVERRQNMDNKNGSIQRVLKGGDRAQAIQRRLNAQRSQVRQSDYLDNPGSIPRKNPTVLSELKQPSRAEQLQALQRERAKALKAKKTFGL